MHSIPEEQSKSIILVNTELDEPVKQFMDHHNSLAYKALKVFISTQDNAYPSKLDFINQVSKELQIRKIEGENVVNDLIDNNWLVY